MRLASNALQNLIVVTAEIIGKHISKLNRSTKLNNNVIKINKRITAHLAWQ